MRGNHAAFEARLRVPAGEQKNARNLPRSHCLARRRTAAAVDFPALANSCSTVHPPEVALSPESAASATRDLPSG